MALQPSNLESQFEGKTLQAYESACRATHLWITTGTKGIQPNGTVTDRRAETQPAVNRSQNLRSSQNALNPETLSGSGQPEAYAPIPFCLVFDPISSSALSLRAPDLLAPSVCIRTSALHFRFSSVVRVATWVHMIAHIPPSSWFPLATAFLGCGIGCAGGNGATGAQCLASCARTWPLP